MFKHQLSAAVEVRGEVEEVSEGGGDGKEERLRGNAGERYNLTTINVKVNR